MKKKDLEDRVEVLRQEQEKKDNAPNTTIERKANTFKNSLDELAKPNQEFGYIKEQAVPAAEQYLKLHPGGKAVKEKDLPDELDKRAESYLLGLNFKMPKGMSEFAGHMMRMWMGSLGETGQQYLSQLEDAIKKGNSLGQAYFMQEAYQANVVQAKTQHLLSKVQHAPAEVKEKTMRLVADDLAGGKEDSGDIYKVVENLGGAFGRLRQKRSTIHDYDMKKAA